MRLRAAHRRLLRLLLAALFAVSAVGQVHAVTIAAVKMSMPAAMDMSGPAQDMDCAGSGDSKAAHAACAAMCATSTAILSDPISIPVVMTVQELSLVPQLLVSGRGPSPEPHPPKPLA